MGEQKCYLQKNTITTRSHVARWREWVEFPTHIMNQLLNSIAMYLQKKQCQKTQLCAFVYKKNK